MMNKTISLIMKAIKDFTNPLKYNISSNDELEQGYYYLKFSKSQLLKGGSQKFSFDENGIPLIPHYMKPKSTGMHYYPISIGQFALAELHEYFDGVESAKDNFKNMADWFVENQTTKGLWLSYTDMSKFDLESPWDSAMAQGRGISVLVRAYCLFKEEKYLSAAGLALSTFDDKECDFRVDLDNKTSFYQEYPGRTPSFVLNGMIFALWGIYDYYKLTNDEMAKTLFDNGVSGVLHFLPHYDVAGWSIYDLYHQSKKTPINYCTAHYHDIHIKQLKILYRLTNITEFNDMSTYWHKSASINKLVIAYFKKFFILANRGKAERIK